MAGRGKEEEGYSVEAQENMGVAIEEFKESLIPIGSEEANKNVFATIKIMVKIFQYDVLVYFHSLDYKYSSPPLPESTICPSSANCLATAITCFCAS